MQIGSSILTDLGLNALTNATISNPINIATFAVSNETITLDPTLTTFNGWITKNLTGLILVNNNTIELTCIVEPQESIDTANTVGIFLNDGTLFALSQPSSPIPPSMRQVIKTQIVFQNLGQIVNFNYIPWSVEDENLIILNNQASLINGIWQLSNKNLKYDTLYNDYYNFKNSNNNHKNIYISPIIGNDNGFFQGTNYVMPLASLDYAIERNKYFKYVRYMMEYDNTYFINQSHNIYDKNFIFEPMVFDFDISTNNQNWKVLTQNFNIYSDVLNVLNNINNYVNELSNPISENSGNLGTQLVSENVGITYQLGNVSPGYWIALLPINNMLDINLNNVLIGADDALQIFTISQENNNVNMIYQTPNFYQGDVSNATQYEGQTTGLTYNTNIIIPQYTQYLAVVVWNTIIINSDNNYNPSLFGIYYNSNSPSDSIIPSQTILNCYANNGMTPITLNPFVLHGNSNLIFQNLNINLDIDLNNNSNLYNPLILSHKSSDSNVIFDNCKITLSSNASNQTNLGTSGYQNNQYGNLIGNINYIFYSCNIITNNSKLIITSTYNQDKLVLDPTTKIDNINNLFGN